MRNNTVHKQTAFLFGARMKFYSVSFKNDYYIDYKTHLS